MSRRLPGRLPVTVFIHLPVATRQNVTLLTREGLTAVTAGRRVGRCHVAPPEYALGGCAWGAPTCSWDAEPRLVPGLSALCPCRMVMPPS